MGILLNKKLSFKLVSQARDTDGRLLCLDINLADHKYRLINVYMHNDAANRKHFINDLEGYLITPREIILGEDFNFVENIELDKMGVNLQGGSGREANMVLLKNYFYFGGCIPEEISKTKGVYLVLYFGYTFKMGRQNSSYSMLCFGSLLRRCIFQGY